MTRLACRRAGVVGEPGLGYGRRVKGFRARRLPRPHEVSSSLF